MIKRPKIAVIGAGGNVGAAVAQWAVQKELGDLVLIDLKAGPAEGRALDLTQCGPWEGFNVNFTATDKAEAMAGADVIVMTAGVPRKPGQSREELIGINAGIVKGICENVKKHAPDAVLVVVSNPLDAMVFVAKQVTGFPRERVIGSAGVLDSARFRTYLSMAAGCSVEDVHAIVLGAHTDKDMVPDHVERDDRQRARLEVPLGREADRGRREHEEGWRDAHRSHRYERVARSGRWHLPHGRSDRSQPRSRPARARSSSTVSSASRVRSSACP